MKDYSPMTSLTSKYEVMLIDKYGLGIKPKCDFLSESALYRLAELEIKIIKGEIDYVSEKDKEIARLTAENAELTRKARELEKENERLRAENAKIDEYMCVIADISEQCEQLKAENASLRA